MLLASNNATVTFHTSVLAHLAPSVTSQSPGEGGSKTACHGKHQYPRHPTPCRHEHIPSAPTLPLLRPSPRTALQNPQLNPRNRPDRRPPQKEPQRRASPLEPLPSIPPPARRVLPCLLRRTYLPHLPHESPLLRARRTASNCKIAGTISCRSDIVGVTIGTGLE